MVSFAERQNARLSQISASEGARMRDSRDFNFGKRQNAKLSQIELRKANGLPPPELWKAKRKHFQIKNL